MLELKMKASLLGAATGGLAAFIHKGYVGGDLPDRLRERMWLGERYADFGMSAVEDLMGRLLCECEESGALLDTVVSEDDRALLVAGILVLLDDGYMDGGTLPRAIRRYVTSNGECLPPTCAELEELIAQLEGLPPVDEDLAEELLLAA